MKAEDIAWIVLAPVSVEHWPQLLGLAMIMLGAMGLLKCLHGAK